MAMNVGHKRAGAIAEINVTPMADVMIVLLIIFMVVTPIIDKIDGKLPAATFGREAAGDPPLVVALDRMQVLKLNGKEVRGPEELRAAVQEELAKGSERAKTVTLKAHEGLDYALVAGVIDACRQAGAADVEFVTDRKL
jgi:biopolymer transport protein ExbD